MSHDLEIMMERERNIQALSAPFRPTFPRNNEEHCIVCFDETQPTIRLGCAHHYCQSCLKDMVKSSLSAAGTFPPKCCLMALPVTSLESHLGKELVQGYLAKKMEMETENRTYCSNKTCSAFIPPSSYSQSSQFAVVECPECSQWTCVRCKQQNHDGDCPPGLTAAEDQAVVDMALKSGWQRCYRCRSMIELTDGCVELQCTCGATFCYRCGKKWRTCSCPRFRGAAYPNEHVDDEIAARVEQLLLRTTNANRNMQASMQDRPERSGIATAELARERRRGEQQRVQDEIDLNFLLQRQQARQREFAAAEAARARQREFTAAAAAHFRRGTQRRRHRAPLESLFDRIENLEGTAHPGLGAFDHTQAGALEARQNHVRPTRSDHHRSDSPPANREMPVALRDRIRRARIMELSRGNTVLENRLHQQSETTPNIPATAQTGPTAGQETTTPLHPFPERRNEPERCRHNGQFILADIADERPACTRCRATTYPDRQVWVCVECAGIMCGQCHLWRLHDEITGHAGWLA
ncbi:MAG: hypothetical protein M1828_005334 [Chrysothrix sp. TS-e1954]|nr:MAG: hypothetical protein M1828_005334 [Chrysothrix sp. TS-e1954]